jgi:beta-glucanase (GH16 family)
VPGEWTQTFSEDFDGTSLDEKRWTPSDREKTYGKVYLFSPECVSVANGSLRLTTEKKSVEGWEFVSGQVDGFGKWSQTYGYFEARLKWQEILGLFPAFWMMPDRDIHGPTDQQSLWNRNSTKWRGMEFDIMEHVAGWGPGRYNVAAHWDGYGAQHKSAGNDHVYYGPTQDGWHVFGMLWEPGRITWFCDGIKTAEWEDDRVGEMPAYFILSAQLGGWGIPEDKKKPAAENLPASFEVDYVRAWQRNDLAIAASKVDKSIPPKK